MFNDLSGIDVVLAADGIAWCVLGFGLAARELGILLAALAVVFTVPAANAETHFFTLNEPEGLPALRGGSPGPSDEFGDALTAYQEISPDGPVVEGEVLPPILAEEAVDPCDVPAEEAPEVADLAKAINPSTVCDDPLTFTPGLRIQPRYDYDGNFSNNDFFIRRFRLKGSGSAYGVAKYAVELKIDSTSRFEASPTASVENAWLDFPVVDDLVYFRAGLYDIPFSLNALTSDSKLLLMDRTLIKEALTGIGFADNTVGVMMHARPNDGRWEYAVGLFDNVFFEKVGPAGTRESDELQPAGRIGFALLDPFPAPDGYADYKGSYLGEGQRLNLGFNAVHLGEAVDGAVEFDHLGALGTDLFFNSGPYVFQTEFDWFTEDIVGGGDIQGNGWYVQGGYILGCCGGSLVEAVARYQTLDLDTNPDTLRWTSLGFNNYIRDHNLKVQTDYTFRDGGPLDDDVFEIQLQLDF